jgi:hypothetical protein
MTYIMYVDESYDAGRKFVILAGFIIPLKFWHKLDYDLRHLKQRYFLDQHINLKHLRRHKYDAAALWEKLSEKEKSEFDDKLWSIIASPENTAIVAVIERERMEKDDKNLLFHLPYSFILERYEYFLSENHAVGIVIMDRANSSKEIIDLYYSHRKFLRGGIPVKRLPNPSPDKGKMRRLGKSYQYKQLTHVCEGLGFMDDDDSNFLQIADRIASAVSSKFNQKITRWYDKLEPILRKGVDGKPDGYGLKLFPSPSDDS